jgi:hypothetical protein
LFGFDTANCPVPEQEENWFNRFLKQRKESINKHYCALVSYSLTGKTLLICLKQKILD